MKGASFLRKDSRLLEAWMNRSVQAVRRTAVPIRVTRAIVNRFTAKAYTVGVEKWEG